MKYKYRAYNQKAEIISGTLEGIHEQDVIDKLGEKDLLVVELRPLEEAIQRPRKPVKVSLPVLAGFTRQLATMLRAGLPMLRCLEGLKRQTNNRNLKIVVEDLFLYVESGAALSQAMQRHPRTFSSMFLAMVRAGESGGILFEVLERVAGYLEMTLRLRQRIRSAMMYPLIVSVLGIGICIFMIAVIIPVFVDIFREFQQDLPLPTLLLINTSDWVRHNLLLCLAGSVAIGFALRFVLRTKAGTRFWDRLKLRLPVFGPLNTKIVFSRFSRTFASLMNSGVPIIKTLEITACAVGNVNIEAIIGRLGTHIENGSNLHEAMATEKVFPPMLMEMVAVGEQTGAVDEMMNQVADYYDREIDSMLAGLTALLEPLLILFLGIVVGSVVIAMFLPIFRMTEAVQF